MITEEEYHLLAKESYSVDSKKEDDPIVKGDIISNSSVETKFTVLSVKENLGNGMQAMAVAPINSTHNWESRGISSGYSVCWN